MSGCRGSEHVRKAEQCRNTFRTVGIWQILIGIFCIVVMIVSVARDSTNDLWNLLLKICFRIGIPLLFLMTGVVGYLTHKKPASSNLYSGLMLSLLSMIISAIAAIVLIYLFVLVLGRISFKESGLFILVILVYVGEAIFSCVHLICCCKSVCWCNEQVAYSEASPGMELSEI